MADAKPDRTSDPRTVFVRGVSFEVGDAELTEAFSALGPVRNAFLIKAGKGGRHKGFGFVQFALQEDADRAVAELDGTELGGRKVRVEGANKRAPLEERKQKRKVPVEGDGGDAPDGEAPAPAAAAAAAEPTAKKPRSAPAAAPAPAPAAADGGKKGSEKHALVRSVALGGLTPQTLEAAVALARGTGAVQAVANPAPQPIVERYKLAQDGCTGEVVMLTYASARDACAAVAELHGQQVAGGRKGRGGGTAAGTTLWARQVSGEGLHLKRWRVVVRNLPFKATEADIRAAFFPAGFIWELTLPRGADGQPRGFAFVGYTCRAHAERAIKLVNGTSVAGRPVAVDWAVAKREYEAAGAAAAEAKPAAAKPAKPVKPAKTAKQVALDTSDEEDEGGPARKPRRAANGAVLGQDDGGAAPAEIEPEQERGMLRSVIDDILGGSGSEGEGAPSAGAAAAAAASEEDEEEGGSEYSSGEEEEAGFDEESGSEGESDEEAAPPGGAAGDMFSRAAIAGGRGEQEAALKRLERQAQRLSAPAVPKTGGGPGCAVFVRGLPLDATREQLFTAMRAFGAVGSCRLVMNKEIDRPKGTAFVDFRVASAAEAAAEACARGRRREGPGVVVAGRAVEVDLALQGDAVRQLAAEKAGTALPADKRNLYLAKEGDVPEGSAAWTALSAGDQNKRRRSAEERATKLRSPNFSMSRTRLAVRNVPPTWDEKKLRELFIKAVKERATQAQPRVAQVKILREDAAPGGKAVGRSKGVGFVEFGDHEHALCALRQLNNNPAVWGAERRPVVEFAVDDVKALKLREARQAKAKLAAAGGGAPAAAAPAAAAAREQAAPAARRPTASAVGNDGEPKSKRKLRKERREMLKEISKRKEAEAEAGPAAGAPLDKAADKAQKRSQRRRLQRQRQKPGAEAAVPAARPAGGRGAPPPGVVQQSSRRKRAPEDLDALAQGGSEGRMVQRPRRQRDALDQLADKYVAKLAKGGDEGRVKPAAGKPKGGAEKRWFE